MTNYRPLVINDGRIAQLGDGDSLNLPTTTTVKLLGDNDAALAGTAADPAWDGLAGSSTWTAIWKAVVARLEAIRSLLAGAIAVDSKQFCPIWTVKLSAKSTSVSSPISVGPTAIMVYNTGTVPAFVRWGTGLQSATINDIPVPPGANMMFGKAAANDFFAVILPSGTATVYVTCGTRV